MSPGTLGAVAREGPLHLAADRRAQAARMGSMRWQQVLGILLGFFVVGPLFTGLALGGGAGPVELLLGGSSAPSSATSLLALCPDVRVSGSGTAVQSPHDG